MQGNFLINYYQEDDLQMDRRACRRRRSGGWTTSDRLRWRPGRHPAGHADGARFRFVAGVTGWEYRAMGADRILLFYEPVSRVALLTFDWS